MANPAGPIPVYGFLEGDSMGLVIVVYPEDTVSAFAEKLLAAAAVRVPRPGETVVQYRGRTLDGKLTIEEAGFLPLDRVDVVRKDGALYVG